MRILNPRFPKEKKAEIISTYLTGDNSYVELSDYYKVSAATIRGWVSRYRKRKKVVSLQPESKPVEDMARKKKEAEKSPEVLLLEELIPEASEGEHSNLSTIGFAFGFVLMMVLDVVMG